MKDRIPDSIEYVDKAIKYEVKKQWSQAASSWINAYYAAENVWAKQFYSKRNGQCLRKAKR
jgi:hypothetical protein